MADWREGALKDETEVAVQHVNLILEQTRQDIEAPNVASANVDINTRMKAIGTQVEHAGRSIRILRDAGVSFEDVLSGGKKDPDLIVEVNHAFRSTMSDYGIEGEAIEAATEASVQVFERWGFPRQLLGGNFSPGIWEADHTLGTCPVLKASLNPAHNSKILKLLLD
jgi:hypothetical protein